MAANQFRLGVVLQQRNVMNPTGPVSHELLQVPQPADLIHLMDGVISSTKRAWTVWNMAGVVSNPMDYRDHRRVRGDGRLGPAIRCAQTDKRTNHATWCAGCRRCGNDLQEDQNKAWQGLSKTLVPPKSNVLSRFIIISAINHNMVGLDFIFAQDLMMVWWNLTELGHAVAPLSPPAQPTPLQVVRVHRRRNLLPDRCGTEMMAVDMVVGSGM
jgi:hypothetical protein